MPKRVPVHIISGFLGVGKTTAILHILKQLKGSEYIAVLVNERGELGLDGALVANAAPGVKVREVSGGCICCTAGSALTRTLLEITQQIGPDRILIEPSGVAKPGEIIDLLSVGPFPDLVRIMPVVCLVDPGLFTKSRMMEHPIYRDQVESADVLLANRCDLNQHQTIRQFYAKAKALFPPKGAILATTFGRLPLEVLKVAGKHRSTPVAGPSLIPLALEQGMPLDQAEGDGFEQAGWSWPAETMFDHQRLEQTFLKLGSGDAGMAGSLERAKGVFHTERGWFLMELAVGDFFSRTSQYRGDNRCQFIMCDKAAGDFQLILGLVEPCLESGSGPRALSVPGALSDRRPAGAP